MVGLIGLLSTGCRQIHVAGFIETSADETTSAAGSALTFIADSTLTTDSTSPDDGSCTGGPCADDSSGAVECSLPPPMPECDLDQDPLRALGVACYAGVSTQAFTSPDPDAWRVAREFGNAFWTSADSEAVLALTTGRLPDLGLAGSIALRPGQAEPGVANDNPDQVDAPAPVDVMPGSNAGAGGRPFVDCDGVGDCSDTLHDAWAPDAAHDLVWFSFEAQAPAGARSYAASLALMTAEFPERIDTPTPDTFVWWAASEHYTGNLATLGTDPVTTTTLAPYLSFEGEHPALLRTGMDGVLPEACTVGPQTYDPCPVGASTSWLSLVGPAEPGERVSVVVALFDQGDDQLDTTVLLDGWRWRCEGCTPGVDCGLQAP